jgi:Zn-dependent M28 family amino/carboxypeptidase
MRAPRLLLPTLALLALLGAASCAPRAREPGPPETAATALATISTDSIAAHVRALAADSMAGRGAATPGYDRAARYVSGHFEAMGLEPGGSEGGWFQFVPLRRSDVVGDSCELWLDAPPSRHYLYGQDFFMPADPVRERSEVDAGLVFAGFGVVAPELHHDDYVGLDVRGKVVVLLSGAPATFPSDQRAYYSSSLVKQRNAAEHGAAGILMVRTDADEERTPWEQAIRRSRFPAMRWTDAHGRPHDVFPQLAVEATLSRPAAAGLFEHTYPGGLDSVLARCERGAFPRPLLGAGVCARRVTRHADVSSSNVIALLPGSDARLANEVVVYSAHLDHLGIGEPAGGDSIYNGAYDNASGVAILLEVARALRTLPSPPKRTLAFVALTGEEKGMQGSDYFARFPTVRGRLVADINLDMILMLHPFVDVVAFGAEHSSFAEAVRRAARGVPDPRWGREITVSRDPHPAAVIFIRSDQFSFIRQGIPAVFPTSGSGARPEDAARDSAWLRDHYHQPDDDLSQPMDFEAGARFARFCLLLGLDVANAPQAPRWKRGDFFGQTFGAAARPSEARAARGAKEEGKP